MTQFDTPSFTSINSLEKAVEDESRSSPRTCVRNSQAFIAISPKFSVTDGGVVPPSGDPHDYMSVGPYWWPDPNKDDGLPYIRRDARVLQEATTKRIARQIEPDGRQPHELARTKSFSYSVMNLRGMFTLASLAERIDVDLWNYESEEGRSIRKAIDYRARFVGNQGAWQHEQIGGVKPSSLYPLLRWASRSYKEPQYEAAIREIEGFDPADARTELLFPAS
ncbi:alginate lyase family protein [Novipirellula artificiosorum]|nr:alginate lyase family protein [Novipirellula artificiosorum]